MTKQNRKGPENDRPGKVLVEATILAAAELMADALLEGVSRGDSPAIKVVDQFEAAFEALIEREEQPSKETIHSLFTMWTIWGVTINPIVGLLALTYQREIIAAVLSEVHKRVVKDAN